MEMFYMDTIIYVLSDNSSQIDQLIMIQSAVS